MSAPSRFGSFSSSTTPDSHECSSHCFCQARSSLPSPALPSLPTLCFFSLLSHTLATDLRPGTGPGNSAAAVGHPPGGCHSAGDSCTTRKGSWRPYAPVRVSASVIPAISIHLGVQCMVGKFAPSWPSLMTSQTSVETSPTRVCTWQVWAYTARSAAL